MNVNLIREFVIEKLKNDFTGHDFAHIQRVEKNAIKLSDNMNFSKNQLDIIIASVLLHDVIDYKVTNDVEKAKKEVREILLKSNALNKEIEIIEDTINNISFSKNLSEKKELTIYGKIVQDADRLDAIGAIGIARTFYYGGSKGSPFYDETRPLSNQELNEENYKKNSSVINHFYEKLLKLKDLMNTEQGKKEAKIRTTFMENFLKQFYKEI